MAVLGFRHISSVLLVLLGAGALTGCEPQPPAPRFVVTSGADLPDTTPGDGTCSTVAGCTLRAAVEEAEAVEGPARIAFASGVVVTTSAYGRALQPITEPLSIDGIGAEVPDIPYRVIHEGGVLELMNLKITSVESCGATAPGKGLVLRRVSGVESGWPGSGEACSNGATVVIESDLSSLALRGPVPFAAIDSQVSSLDAEAARGRVVASTSSGSQVGSDVSFAGSIVKSCGGFTSAGHNLLPPGCAAAIETDIAQYDRAATAFESPAVDAIPAGTPGLCTGDRHDYRGVTRPFGGACDIGALESTIPFRFGARQDDLGEGNLSAVDVNDAGVAVGVNPWTGGAVRYLATSGEVEPLGINGMPVAINASGSVAGWIPPVTGAPDAFRWDPTGITMLPGLGGDGEQAADLNDQGQTVGWATSTTGVRQAVLWEANGTVMLLPSDGREAWATAMNEAGTAVGAARGADGVLRAVTWDTSTGVRTVLPGLFTTAYDVSDAGVVVGSASNGQESGPVAWGPGGAAPTFLPRPTFPLGDESEPRAIATRILDDGSVIVTQVGAVEAGPSIQAFLLVPPDRSQLVDLGVRFSHLGLPWGPAPVVGISPGGRHLVWADHCYECSSYILGHLDLVPRG
ncbi:MAG: choice-of-anchor Q domain-containing protein [Aquihabitans sp.]